MKAIRFSSIFVLALSLLTITSFAQRTRKPTPKATPKPTPVRKISNPVVDAAKVKVSNQLHNV
jgi:hypothetical protein